MKPILEGKISVNQAAELLSLHPQTVRDRAREGTLPAFKLGKRYFFDPAELNALFIRVASTVPANDKISDLN